ncbi:MAG: hypothetical protein FLDDKLPJ_01388 [Phycisphaerae bacterium]|nr:hypothetical protein [Phycisphaerae bacterium]
MTYDPAPAPEEGVLRREVHHNKRGSLFHLKIADWRGSCVVPLATRRVQRHSRVGERDRGFVITVAGAICDAACGFADPARTARASPPDNPVPGISPASQQGGSAGQGVRRFVAPFGAAFAQSGHRSESLPTIPFPHDVHFSPRCI